MLQFMLSSLATWRLARMLVNEDGPWDVFAKLRNITGVRYTALGIPFGTNVLSSLLTCVWCCSVWVAGIIALLEKPVKLRTLILKLFALSAMAIIIEEWINGQQTTI